MSRRGSTIQHILGVMTMVFSLTTVPPMAVSAWYADGEFFHVADSLLLTRALGLALWFPARRAERELRLRDGFLIVALFWVILGGVSSVPLHLSAHLNFTDSVFESFSGFTTTVATVITRLEGLPPSMLFYRQQLQWLGGMGIVLLAVAILPMLGVGRMQLYRAKTPGPKKYEKLTSRIRHTARALWSIYLFLTLACTLACWFAGMGPLDALLHSFSTVSTGGFSPYDASIAHFRSPAIEWVAVLFMLLGGINFGVHFVVFRRLSPTRYLLDYEVRTLLLVVLAMTLVLTSALLIGGVYERIEDSLRLSAFQVVSLITSTSFTSAPFAEWPHMLPLALIIITFIGGCAVSTAGGIKAIRVRLLYEQFGRKLRRLMQPHGLIPLKLAGRRLPERAVQAVWGFFATYLFVFVLLILAVMATGVDKVTAFSTVATCLNNAGPALGDAATNFAGPNAGAKWLLCVAMLLGRREIFTLHVLLTPAFWRG